VLGAAAGLVTLLLVLSGGGCDLLDPGRPAVRAALRAELRAQRGLPHLHSHERGLVGEREVEPLVCRFYERRRFNPAWCGGRRPREEATRLALVLERAGADGLEAEDPAAGARALRVWAADDARRRAEGGAGGRQGGARALASLDVALTRAFLEHAAHLSTGLLQPARLPSDWHVAPRRVDLLAALERAVASRDVDAELAGLAPRSEGYARLRDLLRRYRRVVREGGWRALPPGPVLRRGSTGARVQLLRERLAASGDLEPALAAGSTFDPALVAAAKRFQARHGIAPTGTVGPRERAELDVPAAARVRQIELNLERWRWLPDSLGERQVLVNVPGFTLEVREWDRSVLAMRVVVGREGSRTPLFGDSLTYLVFNPVWEVPPDIAASEVLASIQKDPRYLTENHLRVFRGRGRDAREVDPASVDWRTVTAETFHFSIRQDPGPENAVGHVKFMCPNPYAVYLHDTPAGHLFDESQRDLSHGCVRVERPLALALYLLRDKKGWDSLRVAASFDTLKNRAVILPHPVPVYFLYWTAWVDEQGRAQFRRDLYGLDSLLTAAISRGRGGPPPPVEWARIRADTSAAGPAGKAAPAAAARSDRAAIPGRSQGQAPRR
jgi:murein L,D-transpeptidase YcbB/YkuD